MRSSNSYCEHIHVIIKTTTSNATEDEIYENGLLASKVYSK